MFNLLSCAILVYNLALTLIGLHDTRRDYSRKQNSDTQKSPMECSYVWWSHSIVNGSVATFVKSSDSLFTVNI
jgi:hypothetical protein